VARSVYIILKSTGYKKEPLGDLVFSVWASKTKAYKELTMMCYKELNDFASEEDSVENKETLIKANGVLVDELSEENIEEFYSYASIITNGDFKKIISICEAPVSKKNYIALD